MNKDKHDKLRAKALELLSQTDVDYSQWGDDMKGVVEELSIYQIELEHQNEALRHTQQELENSRETYRDLFENAPVSYLMIDDDGIITDVNNTFSNVYYMVKENILNTRLDKYVVPVYQDTYYHFIKLLKSNAGKSQTELKMIFNEKIYYVRIYMSFCKNKSDIRVALIDLTAKKNLENRLAEESKKVKEQEIKFRTSIEQSMDVTYYANTSTQRFEYISPNIHELLGYTAEEVMRMSFDEQKAVLLPEYRKYYDKLCLALLNHRNAGHTFAGKFKMQTKGKQIITVFGSFTTVNMPEDDHHYIFGYLHNITQDEVYKDELKQATEKAQESERLKTAFLANMSHEIRTPLNSIVGFSQLLSTVDNEDDKLTFIDMINKSSDLLLRLINDILDLSKIESGTIDIKNDDFDVSKLFEQLYLSFEKNKTNDKICLHKENGIGRSLVVKSDRNRITQILSNFMTNALKYTAEGDVTMGISLEDGGMRLYTRDTGIGISEEDKSKVFQRFAKLNTFAQGTGLGLAICKAIAERMGGRVGFESTLGKGSHFWAWIPIHQAE
jgi:PAS domain S-box-containing protein